MKRFPATPLVVLSAALGVYGLNAALAGGAAQPTQISDTSITSKTGTATLLADGTVITTGIRQPGQNVRVSPTCAAGVKPSVKITCEANAFLATLTTAQRAKVVLPLTKANAAKWSNLPTAFVPRNGLKLSDLNATQQAAALRLIKAFTGTAVNEGYDETMKILMADDILAASGGMSGPNSGQGGPPAGGQPPAGDPPAGMQPPAGGTPPGNGGGQDYGSGLYYLAFLGTPSDTGHWLLQFGGHHLAYNISFNGGKVTGATPKFTGLEPKVWKAGHTTYAPMQGDHDAMVKMLGGLSAAQQKSAKLSQSFSDVVLGPNQDWKFPTKKVGVKVGSLTAAQKALVMDAIRPWVKDVDDATASRLLATYQKELNETYVAFSGNASLSKHADYVRIDGPSVWIEFVCQNGVVYGSQIHYHTIWRDRINDYGGDFRS